MADKAFSASDIQVVDNANYSPTLLPEYILLGMVDDYLGRSADRRDDVVEHFYPNEKVAAQLFLRYAIALEPVSLTDTRAFVRTTSTGHMEVVSVRTKACVDAFYLAPEPETGRTSMRLPDDAFPPITSRQYRPAEMDPRFSYLYGVYLRYGSDEPYQIVLANSSGRVKLIKRFLVDVSAIWASHKFTINTAPVCNAIAFEPDPVLAALILQAADERAALRRELDVGA